MLPGLDLFCTNPAQHVITAGKWGLLADDPDRDLSHGRVDLSCFNWSTAEMGDQYSFVIGRE